MAIPPFTCPIGVGQPNLPHDVERLETMLVRIGKLLPKNFGDISGQQCTAMPVWQQFSFTYMPNANPVMQSTSEDPKLDSDTLQAIYSVQNHFMAVPDGIISPGGMTDTFIRNWEVKPVNAGVDLRDRLQEAWDLVNPLLPAGSSCTSGYRSAEKQRQLLHNFFLNTYRLAIITQYGQAAYDAAAANLIANEDKVLEMVRGVGQAIAKPGTSAHQKGKAIDIGGPSTIDDEQVRIVRLVAKANPQLLSGKVLKERNGCVHYEIV